METTCEVRQVGPVPNQPRLPDPVEERKTFAPVTLGGMPENGEARKAEPKRTAANGAAAITGRTTVTEERKSDGAGTKSPI